VVKQLDELQIDNLRVMSVGKPYFW
jgi:hypothetical protein